MEKQSVLFKLMQKDDKKDVLKFELMGENKGAKSKLIDLAGEVIIFSIEGCDAGEVTAEFKDLTSNDKKTTVKLLLKGDSEDKATKLYPFAGKNVALTITGSQMTLEQYREGGLTYEVDGKGNVGKVQKDENQTELDDFTNKVEGQAPGVDQEESKGNGVSGNAEGEGKPKAKRVTKTKKTEDGEQ